MDSQLLVDVALAPGLIPSGPVPRERTVYVVVDVIRATTTLCIQLEQRCRRIYVAGSIESARAAARALGLGHAGTSHVPLLAGEADGVAPAGFDCGNSPAEFAALDLAGRAVVFATTNGTHALYACDRGAAIFAGSLRNASAVARAGVDSATRLLVGAAPLDPGAASPASVPPAGATGSAPGVEAPSGDTGEATEARVAPGAEISAAIVVVCSGRGRRPAYDDTICAGVILGRIEDALVEQGHAFILGEGALIAGATAEAARRRGVREALAQSEAARAIESIGLGGDLDWCAAEDVTSSIPAVVGRDTRADLLIVEAWHQQS
jgi:phosphosulfolactate phosphohydrolase-like enzyme